MTSSEDSTKLTMFLSPVIYQSFDFDDVTNFVSMLTFMICANPIVNRFKINVAMTALQKIS